MNSIIQYQDESLKTANKYLDKIIKQNNYKNEQNPESIKDKCLLILKKTKELNDENFKLNECIDEQNLLYDDMKADF